MAIKNVNDELLKTVLKEHLTPSDTIKTPERLYGRSKTLTAIDRALNSPGRQIFVYGDRGVGKSSLALTAAHLHSSADSPPIHVMCSKSGTFSQVMLAIGNSIVPVTDRFEKPISGGGFNFTSPVGGVGYSRSTKNAPAISPPESLDAALDVVRYVAQKRKKETIIIVDEMERIESPQEREKFAEFIKNLPELDSNVRFIFCGIAHDVNELLQSHPSAGRVLETIHLDRLHHSDLWRILTGVADRLGITLQQEALIRIGQVSDGFPHYVHLIGESLFWSLFDDIETVETSGPKHFSEGIKGALQRTEASLRAQYDKAVQKYRNTKEYEEALWALADSTSDRRQIADIYDSSYKWIISNRGERSLLPRDRLNQRLLSLKKESHGRIVAGYGSGWYAFRENIMRGYVRLKAADEGIDLGRHHSTAGMP